MLDDNLEDHIANPPVVNSEEAAEPAGNAVQQFKI